MADEGYISGEEHEAIKHSTPDKNHKRVTVPVSYFGFIAIAIVLCILGFIAGMSYQKHKQGSTTTSLSSTSRGAGGYFGGGSGGTSRRMGAFGQVTAVSTSSITISNQRTGSSSTYTINSSTAISDNGQTATTSDIQVGDTVIITTSSTSSTTATRILVNPSFGGGFGGGQSSSGSATSN